MEYINPYPAYKFCPKNVACFFISAAYIQTHLRLLLIMKANTMNPDQKIWVHIVCNMGFHSVYINRWADDNYC